MTVEIFILWLVLCFIVGAIGANRKIGYWGAFFFSFLLSPLIGGIIALSSPRKENIIVINQDKELKLFSVADEIKKYQELKESGAITETEFIKIKAKLLNN